MRTADLVTAAVIALIGVIVISDALRLGIGWGTDGPQSGFFPFWLALLVIVTSAVIALQALRRRATKPFLARTQAKPVLSVFLPALGFVMLTEFVGLYVAGAFYIALSMRWLGHHTWLLVVLVAIGVPILTFVVFEQWFLVPMPKGPVEAWLGY
jgi:hypothetical protein